ncbi:hypothetical protein QTP70_024631 [Hemibagrus guttatus]|uniref:ribonuclease H n=1 Tax=Hemibagrus guttatus TaxID=175788 RepID=A0AAE0QNW8_9TELE|nr:hypothetical protein QTP70_024631 [Hemibagrus guttatus]
MKHLLAFVPQRLSTGAARAIVTVRALAGGEGRTWVTVNNTPARPRACPVSAASVKTRGLYWCTDTAEQCCSESWYEMYTNDTKRVKVVGVFLLVLGPRVCVGYVFQAAQPTEEKDEIPLSPKVSKWESTAGSCKGRCFELVEAEPPGCRCDNLCKTYYSCCADFDKQCLKTAGGFECTAERCGENRNEDYACQCSEDCLEKGDCCTNYKAVCKGESLWVDGDCEEIKAPECPAGFVRPPLFIISLDGFRASYIKKGKSVIPNIHKLRTCGTRSPHMRPMYPSKTFPNLYTLATGLYPESHGIVCNSMYDPVFDANFNLRGREKLNHRWWGGQPIWITAEKQGVKAATFFWPWVIPLERRILTMLRWLHLPDNERPYVYAVHSEQPDAFGHRLGPLSSELDNPLREIDNIIGQLMNGLKQMNLHRCVNVIIVGDHGMEETHCDRTEYLSSYGLNVNDFTLIPGSSGRLRPKNQSMPYDPKELVANLTCKMPNQHFKVYLKQHLPKRLHYANNRRIEDVHLLMDRKWLVAIHIYTPIHTYAYLGERVVIGADFNGHVGEGNTGDEEVMDKFGVKERNLEGQMVVDFAKRMDMGVVNTYFQKREEHRVTYKSGGGRTQVDYILCRRGNLKEISDCKVVVGESVARQHRMVVCRMTLMVCKTKRSKIEKKTQWWKLKKEECCEEFRQKLRQALGGQVVLPDDWETTAEVIRETGRKVLGVSSGRRKEDKETWWWNEEVQDSIQRKRLAKKKWDMDRTEENRQECKELQCRVKREVSKAKQKAYEELYTRLDTREGEKDLYRLARQRDRDGKDVQQVRVIKDRDGRVLTNLEKAYDRVPREELWYCMRKSGVAEKYVRVVQDMYERSRTVVRCAVGQTEEFNVKVGLHQRSALSPFLFAIVMGQLSEEVRQESPWTMMFADDIVICSESREQVEENLERWRFALERRGMKVSRSKTEYMCVNEREGSGTVRLQGEEVKKVQEFKYLVSTVQSNGECGKEVKKRVQAGWNGWRKVSGVLCDQKISARIKGKVYRTVVRPAMLYGLETVSLRKRQESELEVAELKMLRFSLGVTRLDRIGNEYIRGTAHVGRLGDKVREARLRWFGHVQRRESEYIGRRMLDMRLPGRRQRGRPKRRNRLPGSCGYFGDHGFDNIISSMQTIFLGYGPNFKFRTEVPPFENIELYNVMCDILGLTPAPNNGTHGSLNSMLKDPPFTPIQPEEVTSPKPLEPAAASLAFYNLGCSCDDENMIEESADGFFTEGTTLLNNETHLPFGRPAVLFQTSYSLLQHSNYISAYSYELHMPLWTAFTITPQVESTAPPLSGSECVRADIRIPPEHTQTCDSNNQDHKIIPGFLYPPGFSITSESSRDASFITNTVPMYPAFKRIWSYLQMTVLRRYSEERYSINVVTGPIFDYDSDGLRDTVEKIREHEGDSPVPTHLYVIITSCEQENTTVEECEGSISTVSFILPHRPDNSEICKSSEEASRWVEEILRTHTARVRDVELLTGLDFYRSVSLPFTNTLTLKTYLHTFEDNV